MSIKETVDELINDVKSLSFLSLIQENSKQMDESKKMKTKFLETWNNVRYGECLKYVKGLLG